MLGTTIGSIAKNTVNTVVNNAKRNKNSIANTDFTSPDVYKNLLSNLKIPRSNGNVGIKNPGGYTSPVNTNYKELLGGMSDYDKMYSNDLGGILKAKNNYMNAATDEDRSYWNTYANDIRKGSGYYGGVTGAELNPILNMPEYEKFSYKDFAYDPDDDKSYQIYADKYKREGQSASERALADTSAATGGMPSSYAAAANAQTQQAYAKKTADMIPVLEQQAFDRFNTNREFDYRDYLNEFNFGREDAQLKN